MSGFTTILYMATRAVLRNEIEALSANGRIVTTVTNLADFVTPVESSIPVTDWLIVHYPKETE